MTIQPSSLNSGTYTIADASKLLYLPSARLRTWISGRTSKIDPDKGKRLPAGKLVSLGEAKDRHFNFFTLIELFTPFIRGGETVDDVASDFGLSSENVLAAWYFEDREAA